MVIVILCVCVCAHMCMCVCVGGGVNFLFKLIGRVTCPQTLLLYVWYAGSSDTLIHCDLRTVNLLMHWQTNVVQQVYIYVLCKCWEQRCTMPTLSQLPVYSDNSHATVQISVVCICCSPRGSGTSARSARGIVPCVYC